MSLETNVAHATVQHVVSPDFSIESQAILAAAKQQAKHEGLRYAGDVTPEEAWQLFSTGAAQLVDVRTERELKTVGYVLNAQHIEWLQGFNMIPNRSFLSDLAAIADQSAVVLLLCRSGKRSVAAAEAATAAGFQQVFNILEGFEGDGRSGQGWLEHDLPAIEP
jgi:rhodanese-related sulfurtransferase